ncbi:MAG: AAA family ATPase [Chloroflexota bacterium]
MKRARVTESKSGGSAAQDSLVAAMMRPAFYPRPADQVLHKETHISHVFLIGDLVYKIKKAVRFSFLDYSTLARRRYFLQEELRLNRRLAPSVYLAVMPISADENGWRLGGWTEPAEYTLVMRRLPEKQMLRFLLATKQVTKGMMEQLADHLANFHAKAEVFKDLSPEEYLTALQAQWRDSLADISPLMTAPGDRQAVEAIDSFGSEFLRKNRDLLMRRMSDGWIRDVHGDLHAEHICFAPEGIQIFDCIEFSAKLRRCDLASEIAFLLMDTAIHSGESFVDGFVERYRERVGDAEMTVLLPYFQCYRALVRAKVHALRLRRWGDEAARYLRFAQRMTWEPFKPFLMLMCGLTGSGKSTLARPMGERLGMCVINSDVVRKLIAAKPGRHPVRYREGIYNPAMTEKTYAHMARQAEEQIRQGRGAILDATFARRAHREKFAALARKFRIPLIVVHCSASDATSEKRLHLRAAQGTDVSDGRWEIYVAQKAAYEPLEEVPRSDRLDLGTEAPVDQLIVVAETFLRARLAGG